MDRTARGAVTLAAAVLAAGASYLLPAVGVGFALANGITYGAFAWFLIAHSDLLLGGDQPWRVARWSGVIGGLSVLGPMAVLTVGLSSAPPGERVAVAALAFGTTWAGVGLGITLGRAAAAARAERLARRDPREP